MAGSCTQAVPAIDGEQCALRDRSIELWREKAAGGTTAQITSADTDAVAAAAWLAAKGCTAQALLALRGARGQRNFSAPKKSAYAVPPHR